MNPGMGLNHLIDRFRYRTWIGWKQLKHSPARMLVACTGVAFANILILMMMGMSGAQTTATEKPILSFKGDIFVLSPTANDFNDAGTIPRRRLDQALSVDGVGDGSAIYIGITSFRNPLTFETQSLTIYGIDPDKDLLADPQVAKQRDKLKLVDSALLDRAARGNFKGLVQLIDRGDVPRVELSGRTISMEGLFSLGGSFVADGALIISDQTFFRLADRSPSAASVIALQVASGADIEKVAADLRRVLPASDSEVFTSRRFLAHAVDYNQRKRPIGIILYAAMLIAFVVGTVIVYQILSADVTEHIGEYATFKAMGFSDGYLLGIIFEEAVVLAIVGFIPGFLASLGLYQLLTFMAGMPLIMSVERGLLAFGFTLFMCVASGAIATRRLAAADPADIFG